MVGRTESPCCMSQATLNAVDRVILAKPARAGQHPAGAAPRGSAPEPAPTSAAAAVGQARRDGAPAAAALPARPGASLENFPRLARLLSGRSTPKSCPSSLPYADGEKVSQKNRAKIEQKLSKIGVRKLKGHTWCYDQGVALRPPACAARPPRPRARAARPPRPRGPPHAPSSRASRPRRPCNERR